MVKLAPRMRTDSAAAMRQLALAGVVAAFAAPWTVAADIEAGQLVRLIPAYAMPITTVFAVRPNTGRPSARVTRFTDFLADYLGASGVPGH